MLWRVRWRLALSSRPSYGLDLEFYQPEKISQASLFPRVFVTLFLISHVPKCPSIQSLWMTLSSSCAFKLFIAWRCLLTHFNTCTDFPIPNCSINWNMFSAIIRLFPWFMILVIILDVSNVSHFLISKIFRLHSFLSPPCLTICPFLLTILLEDIHGLLSHQLLSPLVSLI